MRRAERPDQETVNKKGYAQTSSSSNSEVSVVARPTFYKNLLIARDVVLQQTALRFALEKKSCYHVIESWIEEPSGLIK